MVEIISKSNGPRREDAAAKHFLRENSATIMGIANQLSGGRLRDKRVSDPVPQTLSGMRTRGKPSRSEDKSPYARVSLNGRVIAVDFNSGRQLHYFGEIRGRGRERWFVLATKENRFFTPLDEDLQKILLDLDGCATPDDAAQEELVRKIDARLGYSSPGAGE